MSKLFTSPPTLSFEPRAKVCSCGNRILNVLKTQRRLVCSMEIGEFWAHETILKCPSCKEVLCAEELSELVPYRGKFGFDVIVYVGLALFVNHRGEEEVQKELRERNINISRSEIGYLGKKFITYLEPVRKI